MSLQSEQIFKLIKDDQLIAMAQDLNSDNIRTEIIDSVASIYYGKSPENVNMAQLFALSIPLSAELARRFALKINLVNKK